LAILAGTPEGSRNRNNQLNKSSFALGTLEGALSGILGCSTIEAALAGTAAAIGLTGTEARATIRSGIEAGLKQPRKLPRKLPERQVGRTAGADKEKKEEKDRIIDEFNRKHAVVLLGGKCVVLNEVIDPTFNRPDVTFSSIADFKNYYSNQKIFVETDKGTKPIPKTEIWISSPHRRQHEGIVFSPGKDIPGHYNLFRGFAVKPVKGDWSLYRDHLKTIIANGVQEHFRYLINWMRRIAQDPGGEKPGTSVVFKGGQGVGKGQAVCQFGEIFGPHFLHITNGLQLTGRFNSHLKDALVVFLDESIWGGDRGAEGVLKGMVTEKYVMVEPKGKDAFAVKNHMNLFIASNSTWVVPAGLEERRFFVLEVSPKRKQDHEYFRAIIEQMTHGGREAMLYDLLEEKIDIDLRKIPRTEALLDQVIFSMPTVQKFWLEKLRSGNEYRWPEFELCEHLYNDYVEFSNLCGDRIKLIDRQFGQQLRRLCPSIKRGRPRIGDERPWVYYLPSLATCRTFFEKAVGVKVDWASEKDEDEAE
jgi:hypothetical protein